MDAARHEIAGTADPLAEATDGELLSRFAAGREEAAFAELLRRHGGMVFGLCRRRLPTAADAEDALQATFLALAESAAKLASCRTAAAWLHRVAWSVTSNLRRGNARRFRRQVPLPDALSAPERREDFLLAERLDRELARLPERERSAVLLCCVEGLGRRDAARRVGVPEGTFSARLSRGLSRLRRRLGTAEPAALLGLAAAALTSSARAAAFDAQGRAGVGPAVVTLAKGAMLMDRIARWAPRAFGLAGVLALGVAAAVVAQPPGGVPAKAADPLRAALERVERAEREIVEARKAARLAFEEAAKTHRASPHRMMVLPGPHGPFRFAVTVTHPGEEQMLGAKDAQALAKLARMLAAAEGTQRPVLAVASDFSANPENLDQAEQAFRAAGFVVLRAPSGGEGSAMGSPGGPWLGSDGGAASGMGGGIGGAGGGELSGPVGSGRGGFGAGGAGGGGFGPAGGFGGGGGFGPADAGGGTGGGPVGSGGGAFGGSGGGGGGGGFGPAGGRGMGGADPGGAGTSGDGGSTSAFSGIRSAGRGKTEPNRTPPTSPVK